MAESNFRKHNQRGVRAVVHVEDLEACKSFAYVNRVIADRFRAKAEEVREMALGVEDISSRLLLADLSRIVEQRGARYASLASLQERDLGVRCHCTPVAKSGL